MSASGDLPSIGALTFGEKCPDRSGETLVKCLHGVLIDSPDEWLGEHLIYEEAPAFLQGFGRRPRARVFGGASAVDSDSKGPVAWTLSSSTSPLPLAWRETEPRSS